MKKQFYLSIFALLFCFSYASSQLVNTPWRSVDFSFNFRDGSIFSTTNPQVDSIKYGILTAYKASASAIYQFNGSQHGVEFKAGNKLELKVAGNVTIKMGGCQYSAATSTITVSDKNGTYTETKLSQTPTCFDASGITVDFTYSGPATTLKIEFGVGKTYVPQINVIAGAVTAEFNKTYTYNLFDGSLLPQDGVLRYPMFVSPDGIFSMYSNTTTTAAQPLYHDATHGFLVYSGNSFKIVVPGNTIINFGVCQYSVAGATYTLTDSQGNNLGSIAATGNDATKAEKIISYSYKGDATVITATLVTSGTTYLHFVSAVTEKEKSKLIDAWDFGAEQLSEDIYNNQLTEASINSWYPTSVTVGSTGAVLPTTFTAGTLKWIGGTNDRLRTSNTNLTRYDANSAPFTIAGDTATLTGNLYVNSGAAVARRFIIPLSEDDELYIYLKSSANSSIINFVDTTHAGLQADTAWVGTAGRVLRFVAKNTAVFKIYDSAQKPFYYRILRKDATIVKVTGTVDLTEASGLAAGYSILFKNKAGKSWTGSVTAGVYTAKVPAGFDYTLSLVNANGYIISNGTSVTIDNETNRTIAIKKVEMYTVSGNLIGLSSALFAKVKLVYTPDAGSGKIYLPVSSVNTATGAYTAQLEPNCLYTISAIGVNDYNIPINTITVSETTTTDITFIAKPVYPITVSTVGLTNPQKIKLNVVFTNLNESGYSYSFADLNNISLRDGVYGVSCLGLDSVALELALTSNLTINGSAGSKVLTFKAVTFWPFDDTTITTATHAYKGLLFTGNITNEIAKSHLVTKSNASLKVPMNPGEKLTVTYYYAAKFSIEGSDTIITTSGSTSNYESTSYMYPGTTPSYVTIGTGNAASYITDITVMPTIPYSATITVGTDKTYQTVNEALSAVRSMIRPAKERVKIMIDPGNYEEMIVVDMDNISLINASETPSIALLNKGVDIDANAVRITSYYGHGYDYYSMGTNQKWNADILRVNKENGYTKYVNTGGTSTSGSYWNATVVVSAPGFEASDIIFENSYNQYISKKETEDVVKEWATGGKGTRPTTLGSVAVQNKSFVERAAAIAYTKSGDKSILNKCRVVGRQDSFYGAEGARVVTYKGSLMGGTDYLFGGMTLVAYKSDLAMNTSEVNTDVAYITAAQQTTARGYLMYECKVTSAQPGTETASAYTSKPGFLGRPWNATTSEVVFYNTSIYVSNNTGFIGKSLISPEGWLSTLGGTSAKMYEFGTVELSNENNQSARASWSTVLTAPTLTDGTQINTFNFTKGTDNWDPIPALIDTDLSTGFTLTTPTSSIMVYAHADRIYINSVKANTNVFVYGLDGSVVKLIKTSNDTNFSMQKGLWIVKTASVDGNKFTKVLIN